MRSAAARAVLDSDTLHDLECASAAYAALIERAERDHGVHSIEAKKLRGEWRDYLKEWGLKE